MNESKQHVQVPNMNLKKEGLQNIDPLVYACIKRHMNGTTKIAFPGLITIINESGLSKPTVIKAINRLEEAGYLKTIKSPGISTRYVFNEYKHFEIFSYDFLDDKTTTSKEKAYLIASQSKMYTNILPNAGKIFLSDKELSEAINLDIRTMHKYEQSLQDKNIMTITDSNKKDEYGVVQKERTYLFENFANLVALKFRHQDQILEEHESAIKNQDERITKLEETYEKTVNQLNTELDKLRKENLKLQKELNNQKDEEVIL